MVYDPTFERDGDRIFHAYDLETGNAIKVAARNVRRERTGNHAVISISLNEVVLSWGYINTDKDTERTRLANSADKQLSDLDRAVWPQKDMRKALDLFCEGLWSEHVKTYGGELLCGDPDVGPPAKICGDYLIEGGGTFLFAAPGRGKSYTALLMAVSIHCGVSKLWAVKARPVLYVNLERSRDSMRYRLARVNGALGLDPRQPLPFLNARGRSLVELEEAIKWTVDEHGVEVLILDSISRAGLGKLVDDNTANAAVDTLNRLAPSWLALAHSPRDDASHIFGSMHFQAGADLEVRLISQTRGTTTGIGLEPSKSNDLPKAPMRVFALEWDEGGLADVRPGKRGEFSEIEAGKTLTLAEEVLEYLLMVGKASPTDIAQAINRNRSNVSSLLHNDPRFVKVGKEGRVALYAVRVSEEVPE